MSAREGNPMNIRAEQVCRCGHSWASHGTSMMVSGGRCVAARCHCPYWGDYDDPEDERTFTPSRPTE